MKSSIAALMRVRQYHLKKAKGNKCGHHWRLYRDLGNRVHAVSRKLNLSITPTRFKIVKEALRNSGKKFHSGCHATPVYSWTFMFIGWNRLKCLKKHQKVISRSLIARNLSNCAGFCGIFRIMWVVRRRWNYAIPHPRIIPWDLH